MDFRAFTVIPGSINEDERSVEGVIATETPVVEMDWERYQRVPRTLLMSGAEYPSSRQIPLLDCHNRYTVKDQLGSIRGLRTEGDKLIGKLVFSKSSDDEWNKVREGHVTDISVGFQVMRQTFIPDKTTQKIGGRDFKGPANVATKWRALEGSITPIGADEQAKMRGFDPNGIPHENEQEFDMLKEFRDLLLSRGMPTELDDAQAQEWAVKNADKLGAREPEKKPEETREKPKEEGKEDAEAMTRRLVREEADARQARHVEFRSQVDQLCELADLPDMAERLYHSPSLPDVQAKLKDAKAERAKSTSPGLGFRGPRITGEGRDAFRKDMATALAMRTFDSNGVSDATRSELLPETQRGKGADAMIRLPLTEIARRCLIADGCDDVAVRSLDHFALATAVLRNPESAGLERRDGGSIHTTGSFVYLTENTMNKSMRAGYQEAKATYKAVANIGESVPDFKKKAVYTTSAVGNLTVWPDGTKPDLSSFQDYKDSYGVEAYAKMIEFSWQLLANDDMGAVIKSPFKLGDAARRTINAYFWSFVTGNPTLADGQALFLATAAGNRKKANYISSGLVPTVASIGALEELMRQQVGENTREGSAGPDILNVEPKYLITPTAVVRNVAAAVVKSVADPANTNSNVHNPYSNSLEIITEPLLAANSATAWYLAADPNLVDGIELSFLQGFETPRTWSGMDEKTLTRWWAVAQVYGGKAINHRGWAKQAGA